MQRSCFQTETNRWALVGTMSVGLSFDLAFFQNPSWLAVEEKQQDLQNPTTSVFDSNVEYNKRSLNMLQKRENWDVLSLYFDEKRGIVVSSSLQQLPKASKCVVAKKIF